MSAYLLSQPARVQEHSCPFGQAFFQARSANSISQWTVALRTQYHIRNIQRIERGEHQPGVMLALRLVAAAGAEVGSFFHTLSASEPEHDSPFPPDYENAHLEGIKCLFGPLLQRARSAAGLSQAAMAHKAQYNLRNMGAVEKGRQEPGVMAALALVATTGVNIGEFFSTLHALASTGRPDRETAVPSASLARELSL